MNYPEIPLTDNVLPLREPTLEERAEVAAQGAVCTRCDVVILEDRSAAGTIFGRLRVPVLGAKKEYQLCGKCGLALIEFLYPELNSDPDYGLKKLCLLTEYWL